jgi:DNA-binding CsgD family transcriptional regulator
VVAGEPAAEAAELALRALDGGLLADETADAPIVYFAASALTWTDQLDVADRVYRDAIEEARRRRSVIGYAVACCWRAKNTLFMGDLAGAEEDARNALAVAAEFGWDVLVPMARGYLAEVLLERGDLRGARTTLGDACDAAIPESLVLQPLLHARGWLKVLEGDGHAGLEDLLACGERQARWGAAGPAPVPWRSSAALVLDAQGEHARARELAREEVAVARRFGAPRPLSLALRAEAAVERGRGGLELLQEALAMLEGSQAKLARARALVDLGAALRRAGRKGDARDVLREGLDLAGTCGCLPLAERARAELVAAGARPRRDALHGRAALTHSELRVAELAAVGRTNKEIAQDLFVTLRTVETHLTRTYRKLELGSRSELAEALATRPPT